MGRAASSYILRDELELKIQNGQCAYCRKPASPDQPLTREHVIPLARGGKRKDFRIIVPACARCNHRRGCQELVLFLLLRPRRISAFLDYLATLSPESIQQVDLRVFAEIYAAVWMLNESSQQGCTWRTQLRRLCAGRTLHRRRYAARRVVGAVGGRLQGIRLRGASQGGPSCIVPRAAEVVERMHLDEPLEQLTSRLLSILSLLWQVSAEDVQREMSRQLQLQSMTMGVGVDGWTGDAEEQANETKILPLDAWNRRTRRRRLRVDRRSGRSPRTQPRGRAA